jgi:hypothetical protein
LLHIYDGREGALTDQELAELQRLERFFRLAYESGATAEREKLAHWMRSLGYATGHGDAIEDLLDRLGTQIAEGLEAEVVMEREACAKVGMLVATNGIETSAAIRARGDK